MLNPTINKRVGGTAKIKGQLIKINESINSKLMNKSTNIDTIDYKNYLVKAKQKKILSQQISAHQTNITGGMGRIDDG